MRSIIYGVVATLSLITLPSASAEMLLFNFAGGSPTQGGTWNTIEGITSAAGAYVYDQGGSIAAGSVLDSDGDVADGVSIAASGFTRNTGQARFDNGTGWAYAGSTFADAQAARYAWWAFGSHLASIAVDGLDDALTYDVDLLVVRATSGPSTTERNGDYTITGSTTDYIAFNAYYDGWDGGEVVEWSGVTTDGSGNITLTIDGEPNAYVAAMRLTAVPEPSSLLLLAAGAWLIGTKKRTRTRGHCG